MCIRSIGKVEELPQRSIIDAALAREPELRKLHLQVGQLEGEVMRLEDKVGKEQEKNGALERRNAVLESVIKALCRHYCGLRDHGFCDQQCLGRDYCGTDGLVALVLDLGKKRRVGQEGQGG